MKCAVRRVPRDPRGGSPETENAKGFGVVVSQTLPPLVPVYGLRRGGQIAEGRLIWATMAPDWHGNRVLIGIGIWTKPECFWFALSG